VKDCVKIRGRILLPTDLHRARPRRATAILFRMVAATAS
jgi:hypothetical protein